MEFSDSEWNLATANGVYISDSELQFSDSELDLANIEANGRPYCYLVIDQTLDPEIQIPGNK